MNGTLFACPVLASVSVSSPRNNGRDLPHSATLNHKAPQTLPN